MPRGWRSIRYILVMILLTYSLVCCLRIVADAATERIDVFDSRITVHADATMTVTETITVTSTGDEIKRGIIRDFPTKYRDRYGNTVRVGFEIVEINRDGQPEPFHTETVGNGVKIYIGQKDVLLQPGRHSYTIVYKTDRQLGFFQDYDELYWNVTGTGWTFPIDAVRAVVELPPGTKITQYAAYTGPFGAQGRDFRVSHDAGNNIVFTTTRGLAPREGLTIAVAWPKGIVRQPSATEAKLSYLKDNAPVFIALLGFLALLGYYWKIWSQVGRDPKKGTIIPLFEPPPGFSPAAVRYLMQMGFDAKTLAAAVMDMAVKGFLRIRESNGSYVLEKKGGGQLFPEELELGRELFAGKQILEITEKHQGTLAGAQGTLQKSLQRLLANIYFKMNRGYLWPAVFITGLILAALIITAEEPSAAAGILLFYVVTGGILALFAYNWQNQGWPMRIFFLAFGSFWFFFSVITGPAAVFSSITVSVILGSILVAHVIFFYLLKAPTVQGRQLMDQIEGFKMYLSVAEKERLELLHPPEKTPELFEKYLPYAFALDVENEWSEQFAGVLAQAAVAGQGYTPTWYEGSSWNSRNLSGFAAGLGSSLSSSIAAAATPPSSSSGSGGGGSSGGGGGGGGGSGW
jgi:uncharacterized membrane protein YgcG